MKIKRLFLNLLEGKVLGGIILYIMEKMEKDTLSQKEEKILKEYIESLNVSSHVNSPVIIAMIGLTGAGKGTVAREFTKYISATIISNDDIRLRLRKESIDYDHVRKMAESAAEHVIRSGGNVIMDSDFVDSEKRSTLIAVAKKHGAQIHFVHVHANRDILFQRLLSKEYPKESFFGGAKMDTGESDGRIVALREMWRRTPRHYDWREEGGGTWTLKPMLIELLADIDTTDEDKWPGEVIQAAGKIN